jgi:hypothetical protein
MQCKPRQQATKRFGQRLKQKTIQIRSGFGWKSFQIRSKIPKFGWTYSEILKRALGILFEKVIEHLFETLVRRSASLIDTARGRVRAWSHEAAKH